MAVFALAISVAMPQPSRKPARIRKITTGVVISWPRGKAVLYVDNDSYGNRVIYECNWIYRGLRCISFADARMKIKACCISAWNFCCNATNFVWKS